jgi:hypothetical protein
MVHAGAAGAGPDFSKRATAVSLALHGAAVWLVVALASKHPSPPRLAAVELTAVEVVSQAPAAESALPAALPPSHTPVPAHPAARRAAAEPRGRPAPVQRTEPVEPRTMQSLADLQVHYEDTTRFADHERAPLADVTSGVGLSAIGEAPGVTIPDAPAGASRARGPRPKHDYTNLRITGASRFAGRTISLRLSIDAHGPRPVGAGAQGRRLLHRSQDGRDGPRLRVRAGARRRWRADRGDAALGFPGHRG